ncbi:hypothetical protein [Corynebacterium glyciniphilum]|uniref:hypothetical protein n=1 Tax=Corynebacterium glyciniphilum TaxID=1404244 RepID=UPI0026513AA0|nr:hypothetical protein [Corynebacterium glyciniphilum]MDN5683856.1 hypothetical protein [Corynebacterium glyciniphilum]MDN6707165.1 hypothetical protein [Corynebacterium glyciniphilum]
MKLPNILNARVTRAQIDHPVVAAKVIRKLTGSSGKKGTETGSQAASPAAPAPTRYSLTRTNGIDAAKVAAGVPAAH